MARRNQRRASSGVALVVGLVVLAVGIVWGAGRLSGSDSSGGILSGASDDGGAATEGAAASGWAPMTPATLAAGTHVDLGGTSDDVALATLAVTVAEAPVVVTVDESSGPRFDEAATLASQLVAPVVIVGGDAATPADPTTATATEPDASSASPAATTSAEPASSDTPAPTVSVTGVDELLTQWGTSRVVAIGAPPSTTAQVHAVTVTAATPTAGDAASASEDADAESDDTATSDVIVDIPDEVTRMIEDATAASAAGASSPSATPSAAASATASDGASATAATTTSTTTSPLIVVRNDEGGTVAMRSDVTATSVTVGAPTAVWTDDDPRRDDELRAAVAAAPAGWVLAVPTDVRPAPTDADWGSVVVAAATAPELPGGGLVLFPDRVFVASYGNPSGPALGVMGERDAAGSIAFIEDLAAEYDGLFGPDVQVQPAFEIIATIASASAGEDGQYSRREDIDLLTEWVDAATEAGLYVVLDLQPGRIDFLTQAMEIEELLVRPNVGLALDPEWRLKPDQVHLQQIGTVTTAEVNQVSEWLAGVVRDNNLPQKLLIIHNFRISMLTDRQDLVDHPELATMVHVDGQGAQDDKDATYASITSEGPDFLWWGWKNFYDEDVGLRSPEDTADVEPQPNFISYQ